MATGSKDWYQAAPVKSLLQLLREGNAYSRYTSISASVGNYTFVQLINPASSGMNIYLNNITARPDTACILYLLQTTETPVGVNYGANNRKIGGDTSVAGIGPRYDNAISGADKLDFYDAGANETVVFPYVDIWIPEGYKIEVATDSLNTWLQISFSWYEFVDY